MKKNLLLLAMSLFTATAWADDVAFDATLAHAPHYTAGKQYENVLGPDMLTTKPKEGVTKYALANRFQWIEYFNPTSSVDDGTAEVQTSDRWTTFNPAEDDYGDGETFIQIKNEAGSAKSPVISAGSGKYMVFYVKETAKMELVGIGTATGSAEDGNNLKAVAESQDGSETLEFASTPGKIYGKGTSSDTLVLRLDPTKSYKVTVKGNETVNKDIMLGNVRLYGTSEVLGHKLKVAEPTFTYWDVVLGPDMVVNGGTKVKTVDGNTTDKWGINDEFTWIEYVNPTSTLDDGTAEVQTANRWTNVDPRIGGFAEGFIQVKGQDGNAYAPVLSAQYGKYIKFYVRRSNKFTAYATGSASGSEADGNRLIIEAYPYNSNQVISAATVPGKIYGKGSGSDFVSVDLDEAESYEIVVRGDETVNKDIQLLGITLNNAEGDANQLANKGTFNIALEKVLATTDNVLDLEPNETYTLNGLAALPSTNFYVRGHGASIVADTAGRIAVKSLFILSDVDIDATQSAFAPIIMSDSLTTADTLAFYSYGEKYGSPAVYYTQEECDTYNNENAAAIAAGTIVALTTSTVKTPAVEAFKYTNAANKVLESAGIYIYDSKFKVGSSVVSGGKHPWALQQLSFNNCVVEVTKKSGKAIINWEEGASQIKVISIDKSTFYADSTNTNMRFLRYTGQVDPWRVWGYEGDDKNQPGLNKIVFKNSTFVNVCGDKEFANNVKNTAATTLEFKQNVFANTWRLQKLGGNLTFDFANTDNAIIGGKNAVDNTDAQKFATVDSLLNVAYNDSVQNFRPGTFSYAAKCQMGDPRWLEGVVYSDPIEMLKEYIAEANGLLTSADAITTLPEYATLSQLKSEADAVVAAETPSHVAAVRLMSELSGAIYAYKNAWANTAISTVADDRKSETPMYDLTGRRVERTATGLYIQNGTKILVK